MGVSCPVNIKLKADGLLMVKRESKFITLLVAGLVSTGFSALYSKKATLKGRGL